MTIKLTELNNDTRWIFGQINFQCFSIAQGLRATGYDIEQKFEQAEIINWLFSLYQENKNTWREQGLKQLEQAVANNPKLKSTELLNEHMRSIFNIQCTWCAHLARKLRKFGHVIKQKAEVEQAVIIHWMLNLYEEHGDNWQKKMDSILDELHRRN